MYADSLFIMIEDSRRGFIGSLMVLAAGAAAASVLGGCAEEEAVEPVGAGPIETVSAPTGMHHFNVVPRRVASVRTYDLPRIQLSEVVSTKAI